MERIMINCDQELWVELLYKLKEFYFNHMLPAVLY